MCIWKWLTQEPRAVLQGDIYFIPIPIVRQPKKRDKNNATRVRNIFDYFSVTKIMETLKRAFIVFSIIFIVVVLFVVVFCIVPPAKTENLIKVNGTIEGIYLQAENDIRIKIKNNTSWYYINRGAEKGLNIDSLKLNYLNREADIYVVRMRFGLIPATHIAKLVVEGKSVFVE